MPIRKKLRCYKDVVDAFEHTKGKISFANSAYKINTNVSFYGSSTQHGMLSLSVKNNELHGNLLMQAGWCRGYAYEALFTAYKKGTYCYVDADKLKQMPCAAFIYVTKAENFVSRTKAVLNGLERRLGWVPTRIYKISKYGHVLIGSKKWLRNLPLLSAYLLICRTAYSFDHPIKGFFGAFRDKYTPNKLEEKTLHSTGDYQVLQKLFYKDMLHILMRQSHLFAGKALYSKNKYGGSGHNQGVGDLFGSALTLLNAANKAKVDLSKVSKFASASIKRAWFSRRSNYGGTYYLYAETNGIHGELVLNIAKTLQK